MYVSKLGSVGRIVAIRIKPGSDLLRSIRNLAEKNGLGAGVILSGVGLLRRAYMRNCKSFPPEYPITDVNRTFLSFEGPLEILALSGNISEVEGKPSVHVHITLSYVESDKVRVVGGHLLEGCSVFGFAEVFIMHIENMSMKREFDEQTKTFQLFG